MITYSNGKAMNITARKNLLKKQLARRDKMEEFADKNGYYPSIKGYQVCSKCLRKTIGCREAWFQDFTGQERLCKICMKEKNSKILKHE